MLTVSIGPRHDVENLMADETAFIDLLRASFWFSVACKCPNAYCIPDPITK